MKEIEDSIIVKTSYPVLAQEKAQKLFGHKEGFKLICVTSRPYPKRGYRVIFSYYV